MGATGLVQGGRSRLHLVDIGGISSGPRAVTLSGLTSVLLAIFNGQKYLPHREHPLPPLLREALQSLTCRVALVAHCSPAARHHQATLAALGLAARLYEIGDATGYFTAEVPQDLRDIPQEAALPLVHNRVTSPLRNRAAIPSYIYT